MSPSAIILILVVAIVVLLLMPGSRTKIGAYLLPRDVIDAARKVLGRSVIVDGEGDPEGFVVTAQGSGGPTQVKVVRRGDVTISLALRQGLSLPSEGTFGFRTQERDLPRDPRMSPEVLAHARATIQDALTARGFPAAEVDAQPVILVRYFPAYDGSVAASELDQRHGFDVDRNGVEGFAGMPLGPVEFEQGSLVIDISDGCADSLICRIAAVAYVDLEDDVTTKRNRVEAAIRAMFDCLPFGTDPEASEGIPRC